MANKLGRGNIRNIKGENTPTYKVLERTINRVAKKSGREYVQWKCLCNCGNEFTLTTKQFNRGQTSCGCLKTTKGKSKYTDEEAISLKIYSHYVVGARRRDINWDLNKEDFYNLIYKDCYYCKSPPTRLVDNYLKNCKPLYVNGVDRLDNNIGYIKTNCVTCCKTCNYAKGELTLEEFQTWIKRLVGVYNENSSLE